MKHAPMGDTCRKIHLAKQKGRCPLFPQDCGMGFDSRKFFFFSLIYLFILIGAITLQYCSGFCHTLTWPSHGCTCVPHPEPPSRIPPHTIPQGQPSAPALNTLSHAWNLDWRSISHMVIYMFQCYSLKWSRHLCLFYCLAYRIIITIFLNSIYLH